MGVWVSWKYRGNARLSHKRHHSVLVSWVYNLNALNGTESAMASVAMRGF